MIYAFDTFYQEDCARTVAIAFKNWEDAEPTQVFEETITTPSSYIPGEFYKRELPCLLSLLNKIPLSAVDVLVVDGFVHLNDDLKLGLGGHLWKSMNERYPVVGVAKNGYRELDNAQRSILRGDSQKPLFITAQGMALDVAAQNIQNMHGKYRFPTLLKLVDQLGRNGV